MSLDMQNLQTKYDLRLPRYTSYPTAPHFHSGVNAEIVKDWLGELNKAKPLSLYFHIAYCANMCWFCGCHTRITKKYHPVADYLQVLFREIDLVAQALPALMPVKHIHFGGGSPTVLTPEDFVALMDKIKSRFALLDGAEVAVELDPRTATPEYIEALAKAGVTRASIGVQDFNTKVQEAINRIQPFEISMDTAKWLRASGIKEVNMDLVYGLPHQTAETILETIDQAMQIAPVRIALFGYAHVPWMKKHQTLIPESILPDAAERWRQYLSATKRLVELGYVAIGLDHFALPSDLMAQAVAAGTLNRNFQGYTTDDADILIGMGASGISSLPQGYAANELGIEAYKRAINAGKLAFNRGIEITDEDRLRRAIIERLMCDLEVDVADVATKFKRDPEDFRADVESLRPLIDDGILEIEDLKIKMTKEGRPLVRAACAAFDKYLKRGEAKHSRAV